MIYGEVHGPEGDSADDTGRAGNLDYDVWLHGGRVVCPRLVEDIGIPKEKRNRSA